MDPVLVDFESLDRGVERWAGDAVCLCLGTTLRKAGSKEAFARVDRDYTVEAARIAAEAGATTALLVSSVGADPGSFFFYPRVKGETEERISALPFPRVHILRPSLLLGDRDESRPGEAVASAVLQALRPLLIGPLRKQRPIPARSVARALVRLLREGEPGRHVHEAPELRDLASA